MLDLSKEEGNEHFHGAHPWRPRDELTVKLVEEGGDEVAQCERRRGSASTPARRRSGGSSLQRARRRFRFVRGGEKAGLREEEDAPPLPLFIAGAW